MYSRSRGILYTAPPAADDANADDAKTKAATESPETTPGTDGPAEMGETPADD